MRAAGIITAIALLLSMLFVPIFALLAWVLAAAITWIRTPVANEFATTQ